MQCLDTALERTSAALTREPPTHAGHRPRRYGHCLPTRLPHAWTQNGDTRPHDPLRLVRHAWLCGRRSSL